MADHGSCEDTTVCASLNDVLKDLWGEISMWLGILCFAQPDSHRKGGFWYIGHIRHVQTPTHFQVSDSYVPLSPQCIHFVGSK